MRSRERMIVAQDAAASAAQGPFLTAESRLCDRDIRRALLSGDGPLALAQGAEILEEVRIWGGHVRADYVLSSPDAIFVVEIKSDRDTLRRFEEQVRVYSSFADRVVLVVGWSVAAEALHAAPSWWDVWLAERPPTGQTLLIPLRDGASNPGARALSLARMLPVEEARNVAVAAGLLECATTTRSHDLRRLLAERLTLSELRVAVGKWLTHLSTRRRTQVAR